MAVVGLIASSCYPHESWLTDRTQADRRAYGLPELQPNLYLYFKAAYHSNDMAIAGSLWHTGAPPFGNPYRYQSWGENVGYVWGDSVDQMNTNFLNSGPHRNNILNWSYRYVGIGIGFSNDGRMWATEEFMGQVF